MASSGPSGPTAAAAAGPGAAAAGTLPGPFTYGPAHKEEAKKRYHQMFNDARDKVLQRLKGKLGDTQENVEDEIAKIFNNLESKNLLIQQNVEKIGEKADRSPHQIISKSTGKYEFLESDETIRLGNVIDPNTYIYKTVEKVKPEDWEQIYDEKDAFGDTKPKLSAITDSHSEEKFLNKDDIQRYLYKCSNLESLYVDKHNELLNLFKFTLNLFDRYKYAIKVILYLLKYLVKGEDLEDASDNPTIALPVPDEGLQLRVPKSVIINIQSLIADQKKVQDILGEMKTFIGDSTPITALPEGAKDSVDIKNSDLDISNLSMSGVNPSETSAPAASASAPGTGTGTGTGKSSP